MARTANKATANKAGKATKATETPTQDASIKELIEEVETDEQEVKEDSSPIVEETTQPKTRKQLDRNMLVPVMNVTNGSVIYKDPRTGIVIDIEEFGTVAWIELHVLQTMRASYPKFLTEPWLLIQDDEVVDSLGLTELYKNILNPQDVEKFFKLPIDKMEAILEKAPSGVQELIASKVKTMYEAGTLYDIRVIKMVQELFNVEILVD